MKKFNKFLPVILTFATVFSLAACNSNKPSENSGKSSLNSGSSSAVSDAGYYVMNSMTEDGEIYDEAVLKELGLYGSMYLLLNGDGTGVFCVDDPEDITWKSGSISSPEGDSVSYTSDGNVITMSLDNIKMTFARSSETPPAKTDERNEKEAEQTESSENVPAASADSSANASITAKPDGSASVSPVSGTLGDFGITIVSAEEFTDGNDEPAIRFYYDFTNNSNDFECAWVNFDTKVMQDGYKQMEAYTLFGEDVTEYDNKNREIMPGVTIRCVAEYSFKPDGGTVEFSLIHSSDESSITMEFDPQNLPGRPEPLEIPAVTAPTLTEGLKDEDVYQDVYRIKLDNAEIVDGYDSTLLRVYLEITNNGEQAYTPYFIVNLKAFQDGISLMTDSAVEQVPEEIAYSEEIAPGETAKAALCYKLISDSPVEVIVDNSWFGETTIGQMYTME